MVELIGSHYITTFLGFCFGVIVTITYYKIKAAVKETTSNKPF